MLSLSIKHTQLLVQSVVLFFGERSGDIPVYSLHKIKNLLAKTPLGLGKDIEKEFLTCLLRANALYREESGNNWNCLTSSNLVQALEWFDEGLRAGIEALTPHLRGIKNGEEVLGEIQKQRVAVVDRAQDWFVNNYDNLLYDMDGRIPWAVVRRLQNDLRTWVIGKVNPFEMNIEEMILSVARESGVPNATNAEEAWKRMGGRLFKPGVRD